MRLLSAAFVACTSLCSPLLALGQLFPIPESQAKSAAQAIVLGVQQGISSLPPSAPQSFSYEFDPESETFTRTSRLGPTVFRSPMVLGKGNFGFQLSFSYFELGDVFEPVDYEFRSPEGVTLGFTQFGLRASADVTLIKLAANYGLTEWLEATLSVPLVIVDAHASTRFLSLSGREPTDPFFDFATSRDALPRLIGDGTLVKRQLSVNDVGPGSSFSEGTNFGVGRVSLGAKSPIYKGERVRVALGSDLFFPSPNEDEFAGPASFAVLPHLIGSIALREWLSLHAELGYDYDFDQTELRRLVWAAGMSIPFKRFALDLGFGGSEYEKSLEWTPAGPLSISDEDGELGQLGLLADEDNEIGTTFADLLIALKAEVFEDWVVSAAVAVPLDETRFRPDVLPTLGIETAF